MLSRLLYLLVYVCLARCQLTAMPAEVSPEYVELTLLRAPASICLLDTANMAPHPKELFRSSHIRGSGHFDLSSVTYSTDRQPHNVVHPSDFEQVVNQLGVTNACHVVLVDHGEHPHSLATATRAHWMFRLYGHANVSVMHGGLRQWKFWYHVVPLESGPAPPRGPGNFVSSWQPSLIASLTDVEWNFVDTQYVVVDARAAGQFEARAKHQLADKPGRIKGAVNVPMTSMMREFGALKDADDLRRLFGAIGLLQDRHPLPVIVYCNDGSEASVVAFALTVAGAPDVSIYPGGWIEFSRFGQPRYQTLSHSANEFVHQNRFVESAVPEVKNNDDEFDVDFGLGASDGQTVEKLFLKDYTN